MAEKQSVLGTVLKQHSLRSRLGGPDRPEDATTTLTEIGAMPVEMNPPWKTVVFVLAAGIGRRLASAVDHIPKPMVQLGGVPILERNVRALAQAGFRELIVNLHHLPEVIVRHLRDGTEWGVRITYSYEPVLLGTAGALRPYDRRLRNSTFVIMYGDNLLDVDFCGVLDAHRNSGATLTVTWVQRIDPGASGVLHMDPIGKVKEFVEKPGDRVVGAAPVNAGLLIAEPRVLDFVPDTPPSDLSHDVIPALLRDGEDVRGVPAKGTVAWVDTPADLEAAERAYGGLAPSSPSTPPSPFQSGG